MGEGDQRTGVPECGNPDAGGGVQVRDRSGAGREGAEANRPFIKRIQATFPTWKNVKQYNDGADIAPGVKAIATPGHTVGHMSFLVASGGQQLFIQSDVTGIHQLFVRNPGWFSGFDADGPKAEATRARSSIASSPKRA
jgi:glyoxylase-like metal-dependent hydrolase (beta-lactamase superfamily II)